MVVTIESPDGQESVTQTIADVVVTQNAVERRITQLVPLRGEKSSIEIFLLMDECSNLDPGGKGEELRSFLLGQPASALIGNAYIRNGRAEVLQSPTPDRALLVNSLTAARGCKPASPFVGLVDLIKGWRLSNSRRIVLIISDGIDPDVQEGYSSSSAEEAIETAQSAGVIVYAIYHPAIHYGESRYYAAHSGQVLLAHVAQETGGQAYFSGLGPEGSIAPYLIDIARHLANQYRVEFVPGPSGASGLEPVTVKSSHPNLDIVAPYKVWVQR